MVFDATIRGLRMFGSVCMNVCSEWCTCKHVNADDEGEGGGGRINLLDEVRLGPYVN